MEQIKYTKNEFYDEIINILNTGSTAIDPALIKEFCEKEKDALARKAAKAKENAAKKKAEDPLLALTKAALTDEPQIIADIAAKVAESDETATLNMVVSRLAKLYKSKEATKFDVQVADGTGKKRTVKAYALA